ASIRAFTLWGITPAEETEIHSGLIAGLENGPLRPVVRNEMPLAEAARPHKEILEPGAAGKIVLIPLPGASLVSFRRPGALFGCAGSRLIMNLSQIPARNIARKHLDQI